MDEVWIELHEIVDPFSTPRRSLLMTVRRDQVVAYGQRPDCIEGYSWVRFMAGEEVTVSNSYENLKEQMTKREWEDKVPSDD